MLSEPSVSQLRKRHLTPLVQPPLVRRQGPPLYLAPMASCRHSIVTSSVSRDALLGHGHGDPRIAPHTSHSYQRPDQGSLSNGQVPFSRPLKNSTPAEQEPFWGCLGLAGRVLWQVWENLFWHRDWIFTNCGQGENWAFVDQCLEGLYE